MYPQIITDTIEHSFEKYVDFLCSICSYEARATDKQTIDRMVAFIEAFAGAEGFRQGPEVRFPNKVLIPDSNPFGSYNPSLLSAVTHCRISIKKRCTIACTSF